MTETTVSESSESAVGRESGIQPGGDFRSDATQTSAVCSTAREGVSSVRALEHFHDPSLWFLGKRIKMTRFFFLSC